MSRISRVVGWRGVAVELLGDAALLDGLGAHLPAFYDDKGQVIAEARLRQEAQHLYIDLPADLSVSGSDQSEILRAGASRVEMLIAEQQPDLVVVHAGVVAVDGRALLLPGRSRAGKSTLVRALIDAGATFYSDEFAVLDEAGLVHPYPRAITTRQPDGTSERLQPTALGAGPAPVAAVAQLSYGDVWEVKPLTPGQIAMALADNCLCIRSAPGRSLATLAAVAESSIGVSGSRAGAADAAGRLLALLSPGVA